MARQQGILKFKGNIGSFSMYKTQDGFQGREKSGIEPGRVLNDPAFQRTRENLAEFAQVAQSAKPKRQISQPEFDTLYTSGITGKKHSAYLVAMNAKERMIQLNPFLFSGLSENSFPCGKIGK
ncbi:MAG TPA: hypothetical protein VK517_07480 [Cyclobacteriaceae bacterium]|nr:hypothetical protein [Cyclobacteriaceae bacterium]